MVILVDVLWFMGWEGGDGAGTFMDNPENIADGCGGGDGGGADPPDALGSRGGGEGGGWLLDIPHCKGEGDGRKGRETTAMEEGGGGGGGGGGVGRGEWSDDMVCECGVAAGRGKEASNEAPKDGGGGGGGGG